jgi:hypothetical protein
MTFEELKIILIQLESYLEVTKLSAIKRLTKADNREEEIHFKSRITTCDLFLDYLTHLKKNQEDTK